MNDFQRIFQNKLTQAKPQTKIPVACSILQIYQAQKDLLNSSKLRKETIQQKNKRIAQENLNYRKQLQQKLTLLQQKHDKNRRDALTKVVKSQEQRNNYRKDIFSRHKEKEKSVIREKLGLFKEHNQQMHEFWSENKIQAERSFRSQSAVKPLYWDAVDRKKSLERQESEEGMMVKSGLLRRHEGREELVYRIHERKQEEVHEVHKEQIDKTLQKNMQIFDSRINSLINNIGDDFRKSGEVLRTKQKNLAKKLKDQLFDQQDHRLTIRSNFQQRYKQRSSSLSDCNCRRINNIEQSQIKSNLIKQQLRHTHFGDTLKKIERQPSEIIKRNNQFLTRSQSFRSTVSYNKSLLEQKKLNDNIERLRKEKEITDSITLKKSLEAQGNCYVRKTSVK